MNKLAHQFGQKTRYQHTFDDGSVKQHAVKQNNQNCQQNRSRSYTPNTHSFLRIYSIQDYMNGYSIIFCVQRIIFQIQAKMDSNKKSALKVLEQTSRTFYIPIVKLPPSVQQAVASAYLCLRAIDQVQDHASLPNTLKTQLLRNISFALQKVRPDSLLNEMKVDWAGRESELPEVTLRLMEWLFYCPSSFRVRIADCTASMADRMAFWAERNWSIQTEEDLDVYTFAVAGAVGLILCEIWEWFQGTKTDRSLAIGYGRGLQSVNILRNSGEDLQRGVSFYPPEWTQKQMIEYSRKNLAYAEEYLKSLREGSAAKIFCQIPYALATATVNIIECGLPKLSRQQVMEICKIAV